MPLDPWTGSVASLVALEETVRQAEQLVTRCRTRFLALARAPTEAQVRDALAAGGILPARIDRYLAAWANQRLTGVRAAPAPRGRQAASARAVAASGLPEFPLEGAGDIFGESAVHADDFPPFGGRNR